MSTSFLPSHFGAPFLTTISTMRYDSKGRQLGYEETEVQRLERLAFINASKRLRTTDPAAQSPSSPPVSVSIQYAPFNFRTDPMAQTRLISEPYGDPIELMANRLAEEFMMFASSESDDSTSSSDDEAHIGNPSQSHPVVTSRKSPSTPTLQPGHRRKRPSLSAIPEED